jgi:hypothetical protein
MSSTATLSDRGFPPLPVAITEGVPSASARTTLAICPLLLPRTRIPIEAPGRDLLMARASSAASRSGLTPSRATRRSAAPGREVWWAVWASKPVAQARAPSLAASLRSAAFDAMPPKTPFTISRTTGLER